jgi:hypothetical protein
LAQLVKVDVHTKQPAIQLMVEILQSFRKIMLEVSSGYIHHKVLNKSRTEVWFTCKILAGWEDVTDNKMLQI